MRDRFNPTTLDRQRTMLRTAMGPAIATALADPAVIEVMVNPDGRLWIDRHGDGRAHEEPGKSNEKSRFGCFCAVQDRCHVIGNACHFFRAQSDLLPNPQTELISIILKFS